MKELSLQPYPGVVRICTTKKEFRKMNIKLLGEDVDLSGLHGRWVYRDGIHLIWARDNADLVHELSHAVLYLFENIGVDPTGCNGEPFCYMLSHLFNVAGNE